MRLSLGHNDLIFKLTYPLKKSTNPERGLWNISNRNFVPSVPIDLPVKTSEASSSTPKLSVGPEEKTEAQTLKS